MSARHRRRPTSHRRRNGRAGGLPLRRLALAAGALTVAAGVGTGAAVVHPGGDGAAVDEARPASDRVASSASPMAEEATPTTASPSQSSTSAKPHRTKHSAHHSAKAGPRHTATKKASTRSPATARVTRGETKATRSVPAPRTAPATPSSSRPATTAANSQAERVLQLVNKARADAGCRPLTANSKLNAAAQKYSDVMARSGQMSHTGPDGSQVNDRVEREGYAWSSVGENIAQGQQNADAVMDAWMHSQGHRENILNCDFREIGIGVHEGDGGPWWTQDFGTPR